MKAKKQVEGGAFARLRAVCDYLIEQGEAGSYAELSRVFGYRSPVSFAHILSGQFPIPGKLIKKIQLQYPQLNADWVASGKGKMLTAPKHKASGATDMVCEAPAFYQTCKLPVPAKKIDRFSRFLLYENISTKSALEKLGWTQNHYLKYQKNDLEAEQIEAILNAFPTLNQEWLETGRGEMADTSRDALTRLIRDMQSEIRHLRKKMEKLTLRIEQLEENC